MLLLNHKNAISVKFRNFIHDDIDIHNDIALDVLEHFSYVQDTHYLDIEFLGNDSHVKECDYCGKKMIRNWTSREQGGHGGKLGQYYIDKNSEYPCTDDCCRSCVGKKNMITHFLNHGVTYNLKAMETRAKNGKVPTSRQQIYLSNLLDAKLNPYFKDIGYIDIVLEDDKVIVEYDGSGHYMGIEFGRYTYEEKVEQDYERDLKLRKIGYKIIRIESEYDYLPFDKVIIDKIQEIKNTFETSGKEFFKWVIPKSRKDNTYGKLREIKEEDLCR